MRGDAPMHVLEAVDLLEAGAGVLRCWGVGATVTALRLAKRAIDALLADVDEGPS